MIMRIQILNAMASAMIAAAALGAPAVGAVADGASAAPPEPLLAQSGERRKGKKRRRGSDGGGRGAVPPCTACESMEGFIPPDRISREVRLMIGKISDRAETEMAVAVQKVRGGTETGLSAAFIGGADCPEIDSEQWAIDYSHKRPGPAIHKGVDIPQPRGTPILAVAAGTVIGKFENEGNRKGIEVMLRHAPAQTGLGFWTYSQYTHLEAMSPLAIGAAVAMGQEVGRTANTGKMGRRVRRDALHFAILYSDSPEWTNDGRFATPKDGYWMDPNAFYRARPPYDSRSLAALPAADKRVAVPYMRRGGGFQPADTKRIWPYPCAAP